MKVPGFIRDEGTGKTMKAEDFIKREKKEWGGALKVFAKEWMEFGKSQRKATIKVTEEELKILLGAKRRR